MSIDAMKQALEALRFALHVGFDESSESQIKKGDKAVQQHQAAITALRFAIEQAERQEPDGYGYARRLAEAIWQKHYKAVAPQWKPLDDLMGVLTQIDNMTSGLTARQEEQEPVAWEDVLGAIARGWTHPEHARKTMDVELAVAIAKEIQDMYTAPPQQGEKRNEPDIH